MHVVYALLWLGTGTAQSSHIIQGYITGTGGAIIWFPDTSGATLRFCSLKWRHVMGIGIPIITLRWSDAVTGLQWGSP